MRVRARAVRWQDDEYCTAAAWEDGIVLRQRACDDAAVVDVAVAAAAAFLS